VITRINVQCNAKRTNCASNVHMAQAIG